MAPFTVSALSGTLGYALIFGAIGFGFGAVLEMAGFGDTRKLAAQFYLTEMTVLKVMFTAIVVAAVLVALASGFGFLDMSRVFVNPTYLPSEILGGLIMGVGFVIGGFCPGTSAVAAATFKVDGMLFLAGALVGVGLFGESVASFEPFWLQGMGRFTLPEWLGISTGATLLLIVLMALGAFWGAEALERRFRPAGAPAPHRPRLVWAGAAVLGVAALVLAVRGDPTAAQRWRWLGTRAQQQVADRGIFASPAEVVALRKDTSLKVQMLDLRDEHDYNLFHAGGARRLEPAAVDTVAEARRLLEEPPSTITFLVDTGEARAVEAYKELTSRGVTNIYVLEGGMNRWLDLYPVPECVAKRVPSAAAESPAYSFGYATGDGLPSAWPEIPYSRSFRFPCESAPASGGHEEGGYFWPDHGYIKRVKPQVRSVVKGGCG